MVKNSLKNKTAFITGGSRGIGLAIAKRLAKEGANIVIAAKSSEENPKIPGTVYSAANDILALGGNALPIVCDIRHDYEVESAIAATITAFGGIDIVINNASAINLKSIADIDMKRFDLMQQVNCRGTFLVSKLALPYLEKSDNPHILTMSPPLDLNPKWFSPNLAYTLSKFGMSMVTLGLAKDLSPKGIAVNSLWPETAIATAAVENLLGGPAVVQLSRRPEIVADAAYAILTRSSKECTGNFFIDVNVLKEEGINNFDSYAVKPGADLVLDFFLDQEVSDNVRKLDFTKFMK